MLPQYIAKNFTESCLAFEKPTAFITKTIIVLNGRRI